MILTDGLRSPCGLRQILRPMPSPVHSQANATADKTTFATRTPVAVTMQRTRLVNRWTDERWEPVAVEVRAGTRSVTRLPDGPGGERWRFDGWELELFRDEAEGYYLNITAPDPRVFVMWRLLEPEARMADGPAAAPFVVTVSYNEAARMLDGGEQVDSVPLPPEVRAWLEGYVQANYKPEPKRKVRRRDPLAGDGEGLARGGNRKDTAS